MGYMDPTISSRIKCRATDAYDAERVIEEARTGRMMRTVTFKQNNKKSITVATLSLRGNRLR